MNNENTKKYINLPPFKGWVLENFPFIEEDFDAITNYQMMCKIIGYLNVIKDNNDYIQNEEIRPLYDAFVSLKEYVDNYFDNLDIQAEVDAKLDEMAEHGELAEIIAQYLQVNSVLGFNTKSDLKSAENLIDGSITRTIGIDTYNDGKGHYYKIRTITSGDVIDDDNILALSNYPTLIAEKIPDYEINTIKNSLELLTETTIPNIEEEITTINETTIPNAVDNLQEQIDEIQSVKKMLVIGDSFSTNTSGTPLWYTYIADWHNLSVYTNAEDGTGYGTGTNTFLNQLQNANNDTTLNNDDVKEIYIVGGLNDIGNNSLTSEDFATAVSNTINYAEEHFTNALIYIIGIFPFQWYNFYSGNTCLTDNLRACTLQAYLSYTCLSNANTDRVIFKNSEYFGLTQPGFFGNANSSNQKHPSALGEKYIANFIENGETKFGFDDGYPINSDIKSTPIVCTNGNASIQKVDQYGIGIMIENYNNASGLQLYLSGLPILYEYLMVSDQQGHSCFMWRDHSDHYYQLFPGNGNLNSGTIYVNMPWKLC